MIKLAEQGVYSLIETKTNTKVLKLGDKAFAWIEPASIGEMLVVTHNPHKTDCILSLGNYRIYDVREEPNLVDQMHLELEVGKDAWQGYLLPTGLPTDEKKRSRIIPTGEVIAGD